MRIDVDTTRIELQKNDVGRLSRLEEHVLIAETYSMTEDFVTHDTAVNVRVLHVCLASRERRIGEPAVKAHSLDLALEIARMLEKIFATDLQQPRFEILPGIGGREHNACALVVLQLPRDIGSAEREPTND